MRQPSENHNSSPTRLVKLINKWLSQFLLIAPDKLHIVRGVDRWSWNLQSRPNDFIPDSKIKATIDGGKPHPTQPTEPFALIEYAKEWLFRWIILVEPNRDIRDRALTKITHELERQHTGW